MLICSGDTPGVVAQALFSTSQLQEQVSRSPLAMYLIESRVSYIIGVFGQTTYKLAVLSSLISPTSSHITVHSCMQADT